MLYHKNRYDKNSIFLLLVMNILVISGQWIKTKWFWEVNHSLDRGEFCIFFVDFDTKFQEESYINEIPNMQQVPWFFLVFNLLLPIIDVSFQRAKADALHLVIYNSQEHQFENHQKNEKQVPPSQHLLDAILNAASGDTGCSTLLHDR